jgi:hypothetical protein
MAALKGSARLARGPMLIVRTAHAAGYDVVYRITPLIPFSPD